MIYSEGKNDRKQILLTAEMCFRWSSSSVMSFLCNCSPALVSQTFNLFVFVVSCKHCRAASICITDNTFWPSVLKKDKPICSGLPYKREADWKLHCGSRLCVSATPVTQQCRFDNTVIKGDEDKQRQRRGDGCFLPTFWPSAEDQSCGLICQALKRRCAKQTTNTRVLHEDDQEEEDKSVL